MFSRCLICNTPLEELDAAAVEALAAELEYAPPPPVRRCPRCDKLFGKVRIRGACARRCGRCAGP
jgi:uncharacterized protein with PIN domain